MINFSNLPLFTSGFRSVTSIFVGVVMVLSPFKVWAGPVIIDGTDANDHGFFDGTNNRDGWKYMESALDNVGTQVGNGNKTVVSLGTSSGTQAFNAIVSAFNESSLNASGWNIVHIKGASDIANFLDGNTVNGVSLANTGLLSLTTAGNSSGDLSDAELAEINARGSAIANFVNGVGDPTKGGGLFAMGESPGSSTAAYGWLTSVIPGISVTDVGSGGASSDITLTADGKTAFPNLTDADLAGADPWHNFFSGNFGSLKVLGEANYFGQNQSLILGGGAGTVINPNPGGQAVPEPASVLGLLALGAFGAGSGLKRKKGQQAE